PAAAANANTAFTAALGLPAAALRSNANINASRPYSKTLHQMNADADYFLMKGNWLKGGYEWQRIDRSCNGTWIDCVDAARTQENTVRVDWRNNSFESINARIGYAHSKRTVNPYNENAFLALVPMANVSPTGATGGDSAFSFMIANGWTGYGPVAGYAATTGNMNLFFPLNNALANATYANQNRISELIGMRRYNMADRNRDKVRSSLDWQASEQFSFQGSVDFNKDDFADSIYGLQSAKSWVANLDGTYAVVEGFTVTLFLTYEDQHSVSAGNTYTANSNAANVNGFTALSGNSGCNSFTTIQQRNNNNKIDPCLNWSNDMRDKTETVGATFRKDNFLSGKLAITNDWIYSRARTDYDVTGGNYANNPRAVVGAPAGTIAAFYIPATPLPTVSADTFQVRVSGKYTINRQSAVWAGYSYNHLKSSDYAYEGMQFGGLTGVLPTNEQPFVYSIHTVGVAYVYTFQ
ncbi:MAG TPA: MtrB/PioB family outer membrane beta-barrel protein, partial [Steroidobacteraceae bacterium]|nr:MtrB/PioB family outer membrane beta-barrel protein [Steroidobacteraceae bacterium]